VLSQVRRQRLKELGTAELSYAGLAHVEKELHFCHEVYRTPPPWPVVDVTAKSIEEIAAEVCALTVDSGCEQLCRCLSGLRNIYRQRTRFRTKGQEGRT